MTNPTSTFKPAKFPTGTISQFFGENSALYRRFEILAHNGIDIVGEWDSPIYAVQAGTVVEVKRSPDGYGRNIRIVSHGDLCNQWTYAHLEQQLVNVGDEVKEGQQIGTMGNTGFVVSDQTVKGFWGTAPRTTHPGTHLHLGLRQVERTPTGWAYEGSKVKIRVLNAENGYKGSIDPLPFLTGETPVPADNPELLANLGKQISLLQRVLALYKSLRKTT